MYIIYIYICINTNTQHSHHHPNFLHLSTLLLLLLLTTISTTAAATKYNCNPDDKKVLLSIKRFYNNAYIFSSWTPSTDCCSDWYMVKCDETTHRITTLNVGTDSLPGVLPTTLPSLPFLTSLTFRKLPNITGPIPTSLSKLTNLQFLRLDWNSLTGPIPDFLHTLKHLSYINLSFNKLSGSIPPSLALSPSLDFLRLDRNQLTGTIPNTFGSIKNGEIYGLYLSHNHLSGEIPASLGKINITDLYLGRNALTGDASFLFGKSKRLSTVELSRNELAFDLSKVEFPTSVISLHLEHNKVYGSLPRSLTKLENMNNFNVSYNRLCGKIPTGGRFADYFDEYSFYHNKCLCGSPLPACN